MRARPERTKPTPVRATRAAIAAYAEEVAGRLRFRPGDPLEPLIAELGGAVEYRTPIVQGSDLPESIVVRSDDDFTIFLSGFTSKARDRFTLAHELGHYFVHYLLGGGIDGEGSMIATRWVDPNDEDQRRAEWEANWFAASLLMPEREFREAAASHPDIRDLARLFAVSPSAAETRKKTLGIPE